MHTWVNGNNPFCFSWRYLSKVSSSQLAFDLSFVGCRKPESQEHLVLKAFGSHKKDSVPAPIRMAASCYSSSQLAAISSTVTEPWSISAPVYQWMFIERTVWAASADTTCNQKEETRRESINPKYEKQERLREKKNKKICNSYICVLI